MHSMSTHHPENPVQPQATSLTDPENSQEDNAAVEVPLNALIECLNVYGTTGAPTASNASKYRTWGCADENSDYEREEDRPQTGNGRLDSYFNASDKRTGIRMSYAGNGHPLTLLL
jgi:cell cycle checkpoint protein